MSGQTIRRERGLLYEDFRVGQTFDHHWGRTLSGSESKTYSTMTMNFCPIYFNDHYAAAQGYDGAVINPMLVFTTILGLSVEDLSEAGGPFLGIDDLVFDRPVYDGETVYARSETLSCRTSSSKPGWGIVSWRTSGFNQDQQQVLSFQRTNLARMKEKTT
ncbi:MaoC family dehydratase [Williamsia muralis]|uniref:Dehydratase n=1 Tax=Williamsia marianensis TaxID=85044 RepID=A0A2G3PN05_WILMA|nr:MaoC family dehydratase [Williamsia marianensis]PHV67150.1 dehydratase [Williamsia marianensis]